MVNSVFKLFFVFVLCSKVTVLFIVFHGNSAYLTCLQTWLPVTWQISICISIFYHNYNKKWMRGLIWYRTSPTDQLLELGTARTICNSIKPPIDQYNNYPYIIVWERNPKDCKCNMSFTTLNLFNAPTLHELGKSLALFKPKGSNLEPKKSIHQDQGLLKPTLGVNYPLYNY